MDQYCKECIYSTLSSKTLTLHEKDIIFMEGDDLKYVFQIVEGLVKVSKITINGEEKVFDVFGKGDYLALVAMLKQDEKYIATATCLTDTKLKLLHKDNVMKAYNSNNTFKDLCLSCAMTRTNLFQSQLFNVSNNDIEERILMVLEFLAKKFGTVTKHEYELELPFSKTTLANLIGIRRETLSRKLSIMMKDNIIQIEKNIIKFNRV